MMSTILLYFFDRRKQAQFHEACLRDPYLTRREFCRRRKLTAIERLEEEEMQRSIMIRKSLASRQNNGQDFGIPQQDQHQHQHQHQNWQHWQTQQHQHQEKHHHHHHHHHHYQSRRLPEEWMPRARSKSEASSSVSSASSARNHYTEHHHGPELGIPPAPPSTSGSRSQSQSRSVSRTSSRAPLLRNAVPPPPVVPWAKEMSRPSSSSLPRPSYGTPRHWS